MIGRARILLLALCLGGSGSLAVAASEKAEPVAAAPPVAAIPAAAPLPRPRPKLPPTAAEPRSFAEAVAGLDLDAVEATSAPSDCLVRLDAMALVEPLPRLIGPGACGGSDMVRMHALFLGDNSRVTINPPLQLRCRMAESFANFVRDDLAAVFRGRGLRRIAGTGSYECRGRNRIAGAKVSEHGKGNAIDIHSLQFADGSALVPTDLLADKDLRETLRTAACRRFTTVLGPGSDGYHEEHVHLDLAERRNDYRMCQWNVLAAVSSGVVTGAVPLPRPRPSPTGGAMKDGASAAGPQ
ncbi:MAG TPA: extensin family protein [Pseudolabrys sp.]|nr:extensin family protein [Pseudolabrys sp.]